MMFGTTEQQSLSDRLQRAESEPGKGTGGGKYTPMQTPVDVIETAIMAALSFF